MAKTSTSAFFVESISWSNALSGFDSSRGTVVGISTKVWKFFFDLSEPVYMVHIHYGP
jgi:hypothetical protein